jgi:hypothetical protein
MWAERLTFRQLFAYHLCMDQAKENGAVLIAAFIVAAIRVRGQEIKPSPKLNAVVYDSILLARTIQGAPLGFAFLFYFPFSSKRFSSISTAWRTRFAKLSPHFTIWLSSAGSERMGVVFSAL